VSPSFAHHRFRRPKRSTSIAAGVASAFFVAALALDPMGAAGTSRWGAVFPVALGLAVIAAASFALVRQERPTLLAFYGLLLTGLDAASRPLAAAGVPDWAPVTLLIAALAAAETPPTALALAALAALLDLSHSGGEPLGAFVTATGRFALVALLCFMRFREKQRMRDLRTEIERVRHGIDAMEDADRPSALPEAVARPLRAVAGPERQASRLDHAEELDRALMPLLHLAQQATQAHCTAYFDVDHTREAAFLRLALGPPAVRQGSRTPLGHDPFAFILEREDSFFATDYPRLLHALPWYRGQVRIGTLLAVPVRVGDVTAGVLVVDRLETQALTGNEPALLEAVAGMAAGLLQTVRGALGREELAVEYRAIYAISQRLGELLDRSAVRRQLLAAVKEMLPSLQAAAFVDVDDSRTRYTLQPEALGWPAAYAGREVGLTERTWAAWVIGNAREPHLLADLAHSERMPLLVLDEGGGRAESLLAVPLRLKEQALGALLLMAPRGAIDAGLSRVFGILGNNAAAVLFALSKVDEMHQASLHDKLTGLYNRGAFNEAMEKALADADRSERGVALLLLDLDRFKVLNDTHGHQAGDAALVHLSRLLRRFVRRGDLPARYGGEEFAVILPGAGAKGAKNLAERIRRGLEAEPVRYEASRIPVTASIGVSLWPEDGSDPEALLAAADRALYAAKESGRNRVVLAQSLPPVESKGEGNATS
jgi:diguanylate cyclase (GGDEF)-like protein